MMDQWRASRVTDRHQILTYLNTDRLYAAYAIGDLEPALYAQTAWAVAESGGTWRALALHYRGLEPPVLFVMGQPEGLRAILESTLCPEQAYLTCRARHLPVLHALYDWDQPSAMWRMVLQCDRFSAVGGPCLRLGPAHARPLAELYAHGGGAAFGAAQLEQGVFYGVLVEGRIVAVAGTHLVSEAYGVAAVGNVFTHPGYRSRGYASQATSAVLAELIRRGIRDIVLNVNQANTAAQRIYERLGFVRAGVFFEGPARARWPRP